MTIEKMPPFNNDADLAAPESGSEVPLEKLEAAVTYLRDRENLEKDPDKYEAEFYYLDKAFSDFKNLVADPASDDLPYGINQRELDIFATWLRQKAETYPFNSVDRAS